MIRIAHIITGLNTGGAETMLFKLLSRTDRDAFAPAVWCLTDEGPLADRIRSLGVPVHNVGMRRGLPDLASVQRLARALREYQPDVVQTWLYHADIAGGIAARMAGVRRVAWNIRNTTLDPSYAKRQTVLLAQLSAALSRLLPNAILCCSEVARTEHVRIGYAPAKFVVMPNGFDIATLQPDTTARAAVRAELGLPADALLVGHVARYDPQKDHANLFRAAVAVRKVHPNAFFLCCGDGVTLENPAIAQEMADLGQPDMFRLLGRRTDIARLNAAFDVAVSSSRYGEGFPNVIGEAMACGVPCVVTASGDSPMVVGDTGKVVPPADTPALAEAIVALLSLSPLERTALGLQARQRVIENFDIEKVAKLYGAFYEKLVGERRR